jgi:hypothetical protein
MYQISGDTPAPVRHDYELALKFKISTFDETIDPQVLGDMLSNVFSEWNDGRRPFEVEMIQRGLAPCLKRAVYECICEDTQAQFGTEIVPDLNGHGHTSRWYLEAQMRMKTAAVPFFDDAPKAEIRDI